MNTNQQQSKLSCKNKCNRRSFILKSSQVTAGMALIPMILNSSITNFSMQKQTKEEIYKQLDELVDKNFPVYKTCSQTAFSTLNEVFNLDAENIVKALASFPGIAMRGETCGAVSASLLGIGTCI